MELDEFITATEIAFEQLMTPTKGLPAERFDEPMEPGKWSFKGMAAHFNFWNTLVIQRLEAIHHGREFDATPFNGDFDRWNAQSVERVKHDPVKRVLTELRITHSALVETVKRVDMRKLSSDGQIPGWLVECVTGHYHHHRPQVESWVERLRRAGRGPLTMLPTKEA